MKNQIISGLFCFIACAQALSLSASSNPSFQEIQVDQPEIRSNTCPELNNYTFTNEPPFQFLGVPNCFVEIEPELKLYVNDENKTQCFLDIRNLPNANTTKCFQNLKNQKTQKLVLIIHGFLGNFDNDWLHIMKNRIQKVDKNTAVIIVGWGTGWFDISLYHQYTANTRYMSVALFQLMESLHKEINQPLYTHCIGHSLGAHICGLTGKLLTASPKTPAFNRISGLDPAGPSFFPDDPFHPSGKLTSASRLNSTDADFVDVIHTDGKDHGTGGMTKYGTLISCGDVDFYPGSMPSSDETLFGYGCFQPGCNVFTDTFYACSHSRAFDYYILSINVAKCSPDRICHGNSLKLPKGCTDLPERKQPVTMGYWTDVNTTPGEYTVEIQAKYPFC